jgi:sec-independent protein translocase protein TatA
MGLDGFSIWHLIILLLIVAMIFGTGKLRNVGSDLAAAVRSFREGLQGERKEDASKPEERRSDSADASAGSPPPPRTP